MKTSELGLGFLTGLVLSALLVLVTSMPSANATEAAKSAAPASCNIESDKARQMVLADGTVANESAFRDQARTASYACEYVALTAKWTAARNAVKFARRACDEASSGQSDLYNGTCHLRAAELLTFILGR